MSRYAKINVALAEVGDPPCEDCANRFRCGKDGLACRVFKSWVNLRAEKRGDDWLLYDKRKRRVATPAHRSDWHASRRIFVELYGG